ncbi:MAG: hypothetical protein ABEI96_10570 [Haloarculaceae archaeon]
MSATGESNDAYSGMLGTFPYAFRASDSRLFRSYVVVGGLLAAGLALLFGFALVVLVGHTVGVGGATFSFSRAFLVLIGLAVVAPVVAPVVLVARTHRRGESTDGTDAAHALAGYLFLASLYLGAVVGMPDCFVLDGQRTCPSAQPGVFQPVVHALYALSDTVGVVPPLVAVAIILAVHRRLS